MGINISKTSTVKAPPCDVNSFNDVVLFTICQYLNVQSIARVKQTCSAWNLVVGSDSIWNMALLRDMRITNTSMLTPQQFYRTCLAPVCFRGTQNYQYSSLDVSILVHRLYSNKPFMKVKQYYQEEIYGDTISIEQYIQVEWVKYLKLGKVQDVKPIVQEYHVHLFHMGKEFELTPIAFCIDNVTISRVQF